MMQHQRVIRSIALAPVVIYRYLISPLLPSVCRFEPSCSTYAIDAIMTHGVWRGWYLTVFRLLRCHPFARPGYDPVPPRKDGVNKDGVSKGGVNRDQ